MAFATEQNNVIPGTVDNVAGSIPPPPGFEVPPSAPSYDVLTGTESTEMPAAETVPAAEVTAAQGDASDEYQQPRGSANGDVFNDPEIIGHTTAGVMPDPDAFVCAADSNPTDLTDGPLPGIGERLPDPNETASVDMVTADDVSIKAPYVQEVEDAHIAMVGECETAAPEEPPLDAYVIGQEAPSAEEAVAPADENDERAECADEDVEEPVTGIVSKVYGRRVDQPNAEFVIGRVRNPNLNYAMELFFSTTNPNGGQVDDDLPIQGEIIHKTGGYGLWEEGGSTGPEARAILATNPDGSAPSPFYVFDKNNVVNGKHALVPIQKGSYIVLGGRKQNSSVILVYRVDAIEDTTVPGKEGIIPSYKSRLVAYQSYDLSIAEAAKLQCIEAEDSPEHKRWHTDHPAVVAMRNRLVQLHANNPAYVVAYMENRFDSTDYNDCLSDADFMARMETEPSLNAAYEKVGDILSNYTSRGVRNGEYPHLVVSLNYFPQHDTIAIFCMAKVYDSSIKSSRGKRLHFSRALLTSGSSFYYPDKTTENAVPFDRLKEILTKVGGAMASSFRRRIGV